MSFFTILETLLLGPLKLAFEIIFMLANRFIGHPGLTIIMLSLIMNILVLPLYRRADAMQEEARDTEARLSRGVSHIKKTFSGDERMMILQTYYRQNGYKPTDVLNSSVSLLLEIPFFMAAYQFLSNLELLNGVSLGPIKDLGAPDGLLVIGSIAINVLPILMTLINVISSAIYVKGFPLKTKIQLYAMALFFLVFLYNSPAGLAFYWTLNNIFSLVKNIFYKLKNPRKILALLASATGIALLVFGLCFYDIGLTKKKVFIVGLGVLLQLPLIAPLVMSRVRNRMGEPKPNHKMFILGSLFLTLLLGLLIPSTYISASPQEYVDITNFHHPMWYIVSSTCLAAGTFLVWMRVFYWLASPRGKEIFDKLVWILSGVMLVNYMFFGTNLGVISSSLQYEMWPFPTMEEQIINILVIVAVTVVMYLFGCKWHRATITVLLTANIALGLMSGINIVTIANSIGEVSAQLANQKGSTPTFSLSKNGKNVVVLMMDRAIGEYVPYIFNEKPELEEKFAGFTYYANTISFGGYTNFGIPAVLGGYEYTPVEMNRRDTELLVSKQNEALKLMPVLFAENGFEVTVCDPVYANYQLISDVSIYDDYPKIKAYITKGKFSEASQKERVVANNHRNFFCFSIMKSMPLSVQSVIYNNGRYNQAISHDNAVYSIQIAENMSQATGLSASFMESYNAISNLSYMTDVSEDEINTFLIMSNDTTHDPMLLQEPEYTPNAILDNREYDEENTERFTVDGKTLNMTTAFQMSHYHTNMAAMIQLGKWFDYLRENSIYDNTRIILVSDHGRDLANINELIFNMESGSIDVELYFPLLMVKDFDSEEFVTSHEFMTNADVPTLAVTGLINDPRNPFTGKPINNSEKTAHEQFIILSDELKTYVNNGETFLPARWASVKDNLWEESNWTLYNTETVLTEHRAP